MRRYDNRGVTIDAIIVKDNKTLLIKRGKEPFEEFWGTPGGYVEWDETVEEAVAREVREELGLNVKKLEFIGLYSEPERHLKQCINVAYFVETEGEPEVSSDAKEMKWFDLYKLPDQLAFDHKEIIQDYLKMNK